MSRTELAAAPGPIMAIGCLNPVVAPATTPVYVPSDVLTATYNGLTTQAGVALTVQLKKEENHDPDALQGMLTAIDQGGPNSVYVMVVENGVDIAGMGGLMGTAMAARNFSGAVIDGGVRDVAYLQKIGFPVFALGVVPSTSVSHYRFAGTNVPVVCDGVAVNAGDFIVADADGVVVVPRAQAAEVLAVAQDLDFKEHSMYGYIEKLKSIEEAVKKFGRL